MSLLATAGGITGEDMRDLMVAAVEHRFGRLNRLPLTIKWLSDNGSCYIAGDTRSFARAIGLEPRTTPIESPQSNGMAEAFVRTIKRDYVRVSSCPNAETVMHQLHRGSPTTTRFTRTRLSDIVRPRVDRSSRKSLTVSGHSGATTCMHGVLRRSVSDFGATARR
jgi:putative transposase